MVALKNTCKKKQLSSALKLEVWNDYFGNQNFAKCTCCQLREINDKQFYCMHKIAESNNGKTIRENLIPCCELCYQHIGTQNFNDFKKLFGTDDKLSIKKHLKSIETTNIPFNHDTLISLLMQYCVGEIKIDCVKEYIHKYFFKISNPNGVIFRDLKNNRFVFFKRNNDKFKLLLYVDKTIRKSSDFVPYNWFTFIDDNKFIQIVKINEDIVFEKNSLKYINRYCKKITNDKKFSDFSVIDQYGAMKWLDHLFKVWSNNDFETFQYVLKWKIKAVLHEKMYNSLCITKSNNYEDVYLNFLTKKVIGKDHSMIFDSCDNFKENNSSIGKSLFVIEDYPDNLESFVKNKQVKLLMENGEKFIIDNNINYIVVASNKTIPNKKIFQTLKLILPEKTKEYYNDLKKINTTSIGKAFECLLKECSFLIKDFNDSEKIPMVKEESAGTQCNLQSIINKLLIKQLITKDKKDEPFEINFVKEYFMNKPSDMQFDDFFGLYKKCHKIMFPNKGNTLMTEKVFKECINDIFGKNTISLNNDHLYIISLSRNRIIQVLEENDWLDTYDIFPKKKKLKNNQRKDDDD